MITEFETVVAKVMCIAIGLKCCMTFTLAIYMVIYIYAIIHYTAFLSCL